MTDILFTQDKHIGLVTLNREKALNALTLPMIIALQEQLSVWEIDPDVHAVIVRAAPGKAFCAGGDVRWLYEAGLRHDQKQLDFFQHEYRLNHYIQQFKKPYIALMDGITMGGGVGISLHGSHPVATENFVFAMPETSIGFFPDIGSSYLLSRCPDNIGTYLGLTGRQIGSADAYSLGLVKCVIASGCLDRLIEQLKGVDLSTDPHSQVNNCLLNTASNVTTIPIDEQKSLINKHFCFPDIEKTISSLQKDNGEWQMKTLTTLSKKSPLSLKITLLQLEKAKSMSLGQCLEMDYCLVQHFMKDHDFYEGVRALLIDKDNTPKWSPKTLSDVSSAKVMGYFEEKTLLNNQV